MVNNGGAGARFLEPAVHLLIGALSGESFDHLVPIVVEFGRFAGMSGKRGRLHNPVEIVLHVLVADLHRGAEAVIDEGEQGVLPEQFIADILIGDAGGGECGTVCSIAVKLLRDHLGKGRVNQRRIRGGITGGLEFVPDEFLLNHPIGRGVAVGRAEVRFRIGEERQHPNLSVDVAGSDHLTADRDGDAVDNIGSSWGDDGQQEGDRPDWTREYQKVCPIEMKNWKWLTRWTVQRLGTPAGGEQGVTPALIRSCSVPEKPKKDGGLML